MILVDPLLVKGSLYSAFLMCSVVSVVPSVNSQDSKLVPNQRIFTLQINSDSTSNYRTKN